METFFISFVRLEAAIIERSMKRMFWADLEESELLITTNALELAKQRKDEQFKTCMRWGKLPCFRFVITVICFRAAQHRGILML